MTERRMDIPTHLSSSHVLTLSMERFQLVGLHRRFIFVQMCEWVLCAVVMCIVVCVDGLRFKTGYCVELLDGGSAQASERPEHSTLDFCNLGVLHCIDAYNDA